MSDRAGQLLPAAAAAVWQRQCEFHLAHASQPAHAALPTMPLVSPPTLLPCTAAQGRAADAAASVEKLTAATINRYAAACQCKGKVVFNGGTPHTLCFLELATAARGTKQLPPSR